MRIVQVFNGETPILTEPVEVERDEQGMSKTTTFRVICGEYRTAIWSLDIEVGEWNGIPRIVSVRTEDMKHEDGDESPIEREL